MDDEAVMRQEPAWPEGESAQEFLTRTLSPGQWKAISQLLKDERRAYMYALLEVAEFTTTKLAQLAEIVDTEAKPDG